jgi:hypothetical protein
MTDIANTLTGSVAADGQTPMTGNLNLNSNKVVNLAAATVAGNAVEYTQFQNATGSAVVITGGTIDGTTIGVTTPAIGRFTTLDATGNFSVTGTSTFTGLGSFNGTGALKIPAGTTAQQPTAVTGQIRFNSTDNKFEGYGASAWVGLGASASGSNTQVQYNNSGALAGSANLTFNGTTTTASALSVTNNLSFNSGYGSSTVAYGCRAWVNFDGTGTVAIRASGNVGSITDNGTGDYTLNFSSALVDANYAYVVGMRNDPASGSGANAQITGTTSTAQTTSSLRVITGTPSNGALADYSTLCVAIFR